MKSSLTTEGQLGGFRGGEAHHCLSPHPHLSATSRHRSCNYAPALQIRQRRPSPPSEVVSPSSIIAGALPQIHQPFPKASWPQTQETTATQQVGPKRQLPGEELTVRECHGLDAMRHSDLDSDECAGLTNIQHALNRHTERVESHIFAWCCRNVLAAVIKVKPFPPQRWAAAEAKKECQSVCCGLAPLPLYCAAQ